MVPTAKNWLLSTLDPEDAAFLEPYQEAVSLALGQVLYDAGDTIRYAYFPYDAMISLVTILVDGGTVEMSVFGREGVAGFAGTLTTREALGRYLVQLPGAAMRIPIEPLHEAFHSRPRFRETFLHYTEALLAQTFQIVACNAVHPVEARCCRWLLSTHDRVGRDDLPLTHEFLAEMLGVQRATVSLITRTFQTAGLIQQRRGIIRITDRAGLEDVACECYGNIRRQFQKMIRYNQSQT
jgi:CRP-like cAMP-binding protein